MSDAIDLIERFCAEWGKGSDVDTIVAYFTDDAVYHNIPIDPVTGRDAIKNTFMMFTTGVESVEFQMRNISATGNVVLTERVDVFVLPEQAHRAAGDGDVRGARREDRRVARLLRPQPVHVAAER